MSIALDASSCPPANAIGGVNSRGVLKKARARVNKIPLCLELDFVFKPRQLYFTCCLVGDKDVLFPWRS